MVLLEAQGKALETKNYRLDEGKQRLESGTRKPMKIFKDLSTAIFGQIPEELESEDTEHMIVSLLKSKVIFAGPKRFHTNLDGGSINVLAFFVRCDDIFRSGSDCELVEFNDLPVIYKEFSKYGNEGIAKWCCVRRWQQPYQKATIDHLKNIGIWDQKMSDLPC